MNVSLTTESISAIIPRHVSLPIQISVRFISIFQSILMLIVFSFKQIEGLYVVDRL